MYAFIASFFGTVIIYSSIIASYFACYYYSSEKQYYLKKESGLYLARFGLPFALHDLQEQALFTENISLLTKIIRYARYYGVPIQYTDVEWEFLLFSKEMPEADIIAGYLLQLDKRANAERIIVYAKNMSLKDDNQLATSEKFIQLAASSIKGSEERLMHEIEISGEDFTVWGLKVFGEIASVQTIPFILPYLSNIEDEVSIASYNALKKITHYDAATVLHKKYNSPDVMKAFKQFYLDTYKNLSQGRGHK